VKEVHQSECTVTKQGMGHSSVISSICPSVKSAVKGSDIQSKSEFSVNLADYKMFRPPFEKNH